MGFLGNLGGLGNNTNAILGKLAITAVNGNGIPSMVKEVLSSLTAAFGGTAPSQGGPIGKALAGITPGVIDKMLYMAALNGAIKKAGDSQHFNLETHINDLWVKLSQIRQSQPDAGKLQELMKNQQDFGKVMKSILQTMHQSSVKAVQNLNQ